MAPEREQLEITDIGELRTWFAEHADHAGGVWLVTYKRIADPVRHVPYDAVVRECLTVGWVDSQAKGVDGERSSILLTPRRPGSGWARTNKQRIAELRAAGLMRPRGEAVVAAAEADGSWTALDAIEDLLVPDDLGVALAARPGARERWDALSRTTRRAVLVWLAGAKRAATRQSRVTTTVDRVASGEPVIR